MLTSPQTLFFDLPDFGQPASTHRLVCYQWGDEKTPRTVLCVHGLTRNGRDFDFLAQALAQRYRVFCPDMPGRGKSDWLNNPAAYNNPAYVVDLGIVLARLNIKQVDWIGTSMGGILGMMMANAVPGLIRTLVLNDVGCVIPAAGLKRIVDIADMQTVFDSHAEAEAAFRRRTANFGISDEAHWQHLLTYGIEETGDRRVRFTYDPTLFIAGPPRDNITDMDLWSLWEAVTKIPVLLIRGAESDILTHETAQQMQARHPNLTLREIPDAGHAPALMDETQIKMIQDWLEITG